MVDINNLLNEAKNASKNAYAPYSNFKVGAALLTKDGKIYTGCNVENSSYGATICAERVAILKAVSEGEHDFVAIAVFCSEDRPAYPCGMCLQVMNEFMPNSIVYLCDSKNTYKYQLKELLPCGFNM